jgi:hypothetical protein
MATWQQLRAVRAHDTVKDDWQVVHHVGDELDIDTKINLSNVKKFNRKKIITFKY